MARRFAAAAFMAVLAAQGPALASQKTAVFAFELEQEPSEDEFFMGAKGPDAAEKVRLDLVTGELRKLLAATGRFEVVDVGPVAADAERLSPLHKCNGCEGDLAKKLGANVAVSGFLEKLSATLLNMYVTFRNADTGDITQRLSVVIRGNTDDEWVHAIRYVIKNRLNSGASNP